MRLFWTTFSSSLQPFSKLAWYQEKLEYSTYSILYVTVTLLLRWFRAIKNIVGVVRKNSIASIYSVIHVYTYIFYGFEQHRLFVSPGTGFRTGELTVCKILKISVALFQLRTILAEFWAAPLHGFQNIASLYKDVHSTLSTLHTQANFGRVLHVLYVSNVFT